MHMELYSIKIINGDIRLKILKEEKNTAYCQNKMDFAIVIPFNPHLDFWGGSAVGSLVAHKMFADIRGAVYWDLVQASPHWDIKTAYFYDPQEKAVTYRAELQLMLPKEDIKRTEIRYIPDWRRISWNDEQDLGQVWLKFRNIFPLKQKHRLSDFKKISDGEKLRRVQNFSVVEDPHYTFRELRLSPKVYADDYIFRLATRKEEKLQEVDLERILYSIMLARNLKYVERQKGKNNRIDVAFRNRKNWYIIVEIKKGTANLQTLAQLKRYMKTFKKRKQVKKIFGVILCRKANVTLQKAIMKENNIKIDEYTFGMKFPRIEKMLSRK